MSSMTTNIPLSSSTSTSRLPPELVDLTIDALAAIKGSFRELVRVTLVSRQCRHQAQKYIFEHVELGSRATARKGHGGQVKGLRDLLEGNAALAHNILSVKLKMGPFSKGSQEDKDAFAQAFPTILNCLSRLQSFIMEINELLDWGEIPVGVRESVADCCTRPTLVRLEFQGFLNFPPSLVFGGPSLKMISLLNVSGDHRIGLVPRPPILPADNPPAAWSQRLKTLNFQNASTVIGPYAIARPTSFCGLEGLGMTVTNALDEEILRSIVNKCNATLRSLSILYIPHTASADDPLEMSFLPQLTRMGLFVCPAESQPAFRCPGLVPTLIYNSLCFQRSLELLSMFITFRTPSLPVGESTGFLENEESWKALDEHLTNNAAKLRTIDLVIVISIEGEHWDDPEDRFEELESQLMDETRSAFAKNVEKECISISIDVRRHPRGQGPIA